MGARRERVTVGEEDRDVGGESGVVSGYEHTTMWMNDEWISFLLHACRARIQSHILVSDAVQVSPRSPNPTPEAQA